jgi:hypothetical protein
VRLQVEEHAARGVFVILPEAGAPQHHTLTQIQKSRDGTTVQCRTGVATVTLTMAEDATPPHLHLVARVVFPVVDATYTLSQADQERRVAWVNTLCVPALA